MKTKETKQQQQDVLKKMHHVDKMGRELKGQPSEMERCQWKKQKGGQWYLPGKPDWNALPSRYFNSPNLTTWPKMTFSMAVTSNDIFSFCVKRVCFLEGCGVDCPALGMEGRLTVDRAGSTCEQSCVMKENLSQRVPERQTKNIPPLCHRQSLQNAFMTLDCCVRSPTGEMCNRLSCPTQIKSSEELFVT